jgi:RimJ/RimL family protein N-acetyltransferase
MSLEGLRLLTPRLVLRPTAMADLEAWTAMLQDPETCRFIGGTQAPSMAWRTFMTMLGAWHGQGFAMFSVLERDSGRWVGRCGPWCPPGWPGTEVGYSFVREVWGRGYATEAATAATDWAFDHLGWTHVIHSIAPENIASQEVAKKLGSRNQGRGVLPAPFQNSVIDIWGQSRDEWRAYRSRLRT